jgi:hypothetical protein
LAPVIWASAWGCAGTKRSLDQWFVDALSFEGSDWQHVCMIIWVRGNHRLLWRTLCAHSPKDHAVHCCSPQHSTCLHRTGSQGQCWGVGGEHRVLDGLAPEMKQHLIMNRFCNTDRPLQQLRLAALTGSSVTYRTPSGYTWLHFKSNILIAINVHCPTLIKQSLLRVSRPWARSQNKQAVQRDYLKHQANQSSAVHHNTAKLMSCLWRWSFFAFSARWSLRPMCPSLLM